MPIWSLCFPLTYRYISNVVLEALSSGVPAIVTSDGGPCSIARDGVTGRVVEDEGFARAIAEVLDDCELRRAMHDAARTYAMSASWGFVFEGVYAGYRSILERFPGRRIGTYSQAI